MRDAQLCAQGTALCACGAPPLLHVPGGGGCVSGTGSSTLCGVTRTLSASCDSRRCVPLSVSRSQCIQWRGGSVVRSNVWLSRSSTRRRGTGQAHAARQETTTRRALRDLGARRPSRAFSRGGGKNENHSEGRMRGWHGGRRRACFRDTRYQEERAQSKVDDFMYQNSAFVHIVHILHICYILHFRHIMHILHINILAYFAYFAYFAYEWFVYVVQIHFALVAACLWILVLFHDSSCNWHPSTEDPSQIGSQDWRWSGCAPGLQAPRVCCAYFAYFAYLIYFAYFYFVYVSGWRRTWVRAWVWKGGHWLVSLRLGTAWLSVEITLKPLLTPNNWTYFSAYYLHIVHIVHIAICRICRIWTWHYFSAYSLPYFAYCFAYCRIFFDIFCILFILQYAKYAESEHGTIFWHIVWHILHIVLHTVAYYLTYSAYFAYCNMQNMQNLNMALFFCILFCILYILFCIYIFQYAK